MSDYNDILPPVPREVHAQVIDLGAARRVRAAEQRPGGWFTQHPGVDPDTLVCPACARKVTAEQILARARYDSTGGAWLGRARTLATFLDRARFRWDGLQDILNGACSRECESIMRHRRDAADRRAARERRARKRKREREREERARARAGR